MDERLVTAFAFIEASGYLAPILFILLHILRQFLFIPVALVCMAGGILFGSLLGTVYSLIGLTLLSIGFYFVIKWLPGVSNKLFKMKGKWFGQSAVLTTGQISILKLIPFFHYQLLNLCLVERKRQFYSFTKASLLSNLPLAFFYTVFGQYITRFSPTMMIILLFSLVLLFYVLREKVRVVRWNEFFETSKG